MIIIKKRFAIYPILCLIMTEFFWILTTKYFDINKGIAHLCMIQIPLLTAFVIGRKYIFLKFKWTCDVKKKVLCCLIVPIILVFLQILLSMLVINWMQLASDKNLSSAYVIKEVLSWPTVVLIILNLPFALSEEAAWRGYYLNILKEHHQPLWFVDVGWWLWHLSFLVRGMNFRSELWLSVLLMLIYCLLLGGILRRMRQAGSVLISVAFVHSMVNTLWNLKIGQQLSNMTSIFLGPTGLVSLTTLLLTYWLYCFIIRKAESRSINKVVCNEV